MIAAAVLSGSGRALWYLTRGTGAVTLVLLTLSVVLGVADQRRWRSERWPRFVIDGLHRSVSLLVLALLAVHILTSVVDGYAPIGLLDAVVPLHSSYRPLWLGLGAAALDLLVAVTLTSVLRRHVGHRAWRTVHWLAYLCWPVAVVHGLGSGTDASSAWMLALVAACVAAVLAAASSRVAARRPDHRAGRRAAFAALAVAPLALALWLDVGPLAPHWARRAGTPARLLSATGTSNVTVGVRRPGATFAAPFSASLSGSVTQTPAASGNRAVDLDLILAGPGARRLWVHIQGPPAPGGGVTMMASQVSLGATGAVQFRGAIASLSGQDLLARVSSADGRTLALRVVLRLSASGSRATGTVAASATAGA